MASKNNRYVHVHSGNVVRDSRDLTSNYISKTTAQFAARRIEYSSNSEKIKLTTDKKNSKKFKCGSSASSKPVVRNVKKKYKRSSKNAKPNIRVKDKQETKKTMPKNKGKFTLIITTLIIFIALLVCCFGFLYFSDIFKIEEIEITGADHLTNTEVLQIASIPQEENLLHLDTAKIEASLKRDAWVADVTCIRKFPNTLEININEKQISCIVAVDSHDMKETKNWFLSTDRTWIMSVPEKNSKAASYISPKIFEDAESCLKLEKIGLGIYPSIGATCTDSKILEILEIPDKMTTTLRSMLHKINYENRQNYILTLNNGVEIAFGDSEKVREKELVCLEIMDKYPGKVTYINVRVPDFPTYRTL